MTTNMNFLRESMPLSLSNDHHLILSRPSFAWGSAERGFPSLRLPLPQPVGVTYAIVPARLALASLHCRHHHSSSTPASPTTASPTINATRCIVPLLSPPRERMSVYWVPA